MGDAKEGVEVVLDLGEDVLCEVRRASVKVENRLLGKTSDSVLETIDKAHVVFRVDRFLHIEEERLV